MTMATPEPKAGQGTSGLSLLLRLYIAAFFLVLYGPLLILLVLSFNDSATVALPLKGVTVKWYSFVLTDPALRASLLNSAIVGVLSGAIATALALAAALGMRRSSLLSSLLLPIILIPVILPGIIGGVVLLVMFGYLGMPFQLLTTVLIAHVNWAIPFAFLTLYPRLQGFDASLEEAAMDLGATPLMVFTKVIFPLVRPAVFATFLFSFTLSFDEFVRTLFVTGTEQTLPIRIWTLVNDEVAPYLPALSMIVIGISVALSGLGSILTTKKKSL